MIIVYHNKKFLDFNLKSDEILKEMAKALTAGDLITVANVDTSDLQEAFKLTNHIDHAWQDNKKVIRSIGSARSTSVGDILELKGIRYIVADCGFVKL